MKPTTMTLLLIMVVSTMTTTTTKAYVSHSVPSPVSAKQFLAPHNKARTALRMRPLAWDKRLENYAKWWAGQRRFDCALQHSNGPYGENIFWGSGFGWTAPQAVAAWLGERRWYDYNSNACLPGKLCGHFTQIVWRETRKIGCAKITCVAGRGEFVVCNYDPPGNYIGERPY